jgi:hypothetical protein
MSGALKVGDRVRVTGRNRLAYFQPGDKGTVLRFSESAVTGERYYVVAMDIDDPTASGALFYESEIEPDV